MGTNEIRTINTSLKKLNQLEDDGKIYVFTCSIGQDCNFEILQKLSKYGSPICISSYHDLDFADFDKSFGISYLAIS
jgi:hypothetical protein